MRGNFTGDFYQTFKKNNNVYCKYFLPENRNEKILFLTLSLSIELP